MIPYNIVKHCPGCRKRFLVKQGESRKNYCDECQQKYYNERNAVEAQRLEKNKKQVETNRVAKVKKQQEAKKTEAKKAEKSSKKIVKKTIVKKQ